MTGGGRFACRECPETFNDHAVAVDHVFDLHIDVEDYLTDRHNEEVDDGR